MKNKYLVLFLGLIIFSLGSVVVSSRTVEKIHKKNIDMRKKQIESSRIIDLLNEMSNIAYNSESRGLSNVLLVNRENDSIPIKELIDESKLVYRFYQRTCVQCYEDELDMLKKISDHIGSDKILIVSDLDISDMKVILSRKKIGSPFFKYEKRFNVPFDQKEINAKDIPTFFVLDTNLKTDLVYMAGGNQHISSPYFKRIEEYFTEEF